VFSKVSFFQKTKKPKNEKIAGRKMDVQGIANCPHSGLNPSPYSIPPLETQLVPFFSYFYKFPFFPNSKQFRLPNS
jgi:hypothetical protein